MSDYVHFFPRNCQLLPNCRGSKWKGLRTTEPSLLPPSLSSRFLSPLTFPPSNTEQYPGKNDQRKRRRREGSSRFGGAAFSPPPLAFCCFAPSFLVIVQLFLSLSLSLVGGAYFLLSFWAVHSLLPSGWCHCAFWAWSLKKCVSNSMRVFLWKRERTTKEGGRTAAPHKRGEEGTHHPKKMTSETQCMEERQRRNWRPPTRTMKERAGICFNLQSHLK